MSDALLEKYKAKLEPLVPLATKAYGSRSNDTPAHRASRKYTELLVEYYEQGGSLVAMANELGVVYAGLRRRVTTADAPVREAKPRSRFEPEQLDAAVERIKAAKAKGTEEYHAQLAKEYDKGVSLAKVATALGLSSSNPLYYGVQRAHSRRGA